jgi:heat shock protein HslJ/membrane-bound inhibitor of C-type lysozyme
MNTWCRRILVVPAAFIVLAPDGASGQAAQTDAASLAGSSWQLVQFRGGDDKILTSQVRTSYTIEFGKDGTLAARIDCNRGHGTWKSAGPSQLTLGVMAITRAMCPPGSLHDRILKDWTYVRSYVIRNGHLFLSLMADGGIYEFEPFGGGTTAIRSPVASKGPVTYQCDPPARGADSLRATFYETTPPMVLLERSNETRPAFLVRSASGAKYEGNDVMFWEARGEASVTWSSDEVKCRPR